MPDMNLQRKVQGKNYDYETLDDDFAVSSFEEDHLIGDDAHL